MLSDEKLLSLFTLSAYAGGYCGLFLKDKKLEHINHFRRYLTGEIPFSEQLLQETQPAMMKEVGATNVREYIYGKHPEVVLERIAKETGHSIEDIIRHPEILCKEPVHAFRVQAALLCPVNFYRVESVLPDKLKAKLLYLPSLPYRELVVEKGLELPKVGDTVSGHWNHYLEQAIIRTSPDFPRYMQMSRQYLLRIEPLLKQAGKILRQS